MKYQATFGIDCGVSHGFGIKYPDYVREKKTFSADSPQIAYQNAMGLARKLADNYLSNPNNGLTTVKLLSLRSSEGNVPFDALKSVVKRSMLEHLLALDYESESNE